MRAFKRIASLFLCVPLALALVPCVAFGATGHTAAGHVPEWCPGGSDGDTVTAYCGKCGVVITNHVAIPIEGEMKASEIAKRVAKEKSERMQISALAGNDGVIRVHVDLQIVGDTKLTVDEDLEVHSIVQEIENRAYSLEIYGDNTYELTVTDGGIVIGGSVYVNSGKVIATSTNGTAISAEKEVELSGGSVTAKGLTRGLFGGTRVTISGDAKVIANAEPVSSTKSREFFAGICSDGVISVTGGDVSSKAGSMGMSAKGQITISGGTVSVGEEKSDLPAIFSRTGVKVEEPAAVLSPAGVSEVKAKGIAGTTKTMIDGYTLGVSSTDGADGTGGTGSNAGGAGDSGVVVATHLEVGPKPAEPEPESGNTGEGPGDTGNDPGNTGGESSNQGRDPGTGGGTGNEGDDPNNPGGSGNNDGNGGSGDNNGGNSGGNSGNGDGSGGNSGNGGTSNGNGDGTGGNTGGNGNNSGDGGAGNGGDSGNGGNSGGGDTVNPSSTDPNNAGGTGNNAGGTNGVNTNGVTNSTLYTTSNTSNTALNAATLAAAATTGEADGAGAAFNPLRVKGKKSTNSTIKLTWRKVTGATSYIVFGTKCGRSNRYQLLETVAGTSFTDRGLKKGTYYRYFVVALGNGKMLSQSKTVHVATTGGKVTNFKKVTLPFTSLTLTPGATYRLEPTASPVKPALKVKVHKGFRYESSNKKVAKVGKAGKITAKGAGTCYIYAFVQNGIFARVKVTVTA